MSRTVLPNEAQALTTAEMLLRFAAENAKELPRQTVATICAALDAQATDAWNEQIATDFWCAFNTLCELVRPATVDTLTTNFIATPLPRWAFWIRNPKPISLSKRTARRYLVLLLVLLGLSVVLGFVASTSARLHKESKVLSQEADKLKEQMTEQIAALRRQGVEAFVAADKEEQRLAIAKLLSLLSDHRYLHDQTLQKNAMMSRLLIFGEYQGVEPVKLSDPDSLQAVQSAIRAYDSERRAVAANALSSQVLIDIIATSVLPIVLGLMGACAYVVRLISEQIKDTTFSASSPIRHFVRVALGGLAGVVVGFGGLVTEVGLSSSALAFLAGYAVEPVFSTFDGIAEKFRR